MNEAIRVAADPRDEAMRAELAASPRVVDMLARGAAINPQADGLVYLRHALDPAPVVYSFDQYLGLVKAAETWMRAQGIGPGDAVGVFLPSCPAAVVSIWAASACGVAEPLNLLFSREALAAQLTAVGARLLIVPPPGAPGGLYEKVAGLESQVPSLRVVVAPLDGSVAYDGEVLAPDPAWAQDYGRCEDAAQADRLAFYLPTGGTTGAPKIAKLSQRNIVASCLGSKLAYDVRAGDVYLVALPLFHVGGLCVGSGAAGAAGAALVYPGPAGARDPGVIANFWNLVERFGVTHGGHVPTGLGAIADVPVGEADISSLRVAPTGGSICPPEIERRFLARWGGPQVSQVYGQTETGGGVTHDFYPAPNRPERVGTANPLVRLAIRNGDEFYDGPWPSPVGELTAQGPHVFKGYVDEAQTRSALRDGWLHTGDIARIDADGYVEILGRVKDLIIRSGHNIDPRAIEDAAMEFPGVALAAAVGRPDSYAGEIPALYVSAQPGVEIDAAALSAFVQERIFEAPARPKHIAVVADMPVTPVGKIFKPKLRELATGEAAREALAAAGLADRVEALAASDPDRGLVIRARARADDVRAAREALEKFPVKVIVETID